MSLQKIVAKNIKGYRIKRHLTQEGLAAKAEMHSNHLARMERGEQGVAATLATIEKLAKAFKIPPHVLLIPESYKND